MSQPTSTETRAAQAAVPSREREINTSFSAGYNTKRTMTVGCSPSPMPCSESHSSEGSLRILAPQVMFLLSTMRPRSVWHSVGASTFALASELMSDSSRSTTVPRTLDLDRSTIFVYLSALYSSGKIQSANWLIAVEQSLP